MENPQKIIEIFVKAAVLAGDYVREFRKKHDLGISYKSDNSPLTKADIAAHHQIIDFLQTYLPDIPIISEEHIIELSPTDKYFILVDPIDGTRNYMRGDNDYTINIALIEDNRPIIGVIYVPEDEDCFLASKGDGAFSSKRDNITQLTKLYVNNNIDNGITAILSGRAEKDKNFARYNLNQSVETIIYMGSAKKFTMIAKGEADFYPRSGQTGEWDTASGDIIVHEAGGMVHDLQEKLISYRKHNFLNQGFFASSRKIFI